MPAVTDLPHQNTLRTKTRQTRSHQHNKMRDKYIKSSRIDATIAAIQRGEFSNYATAAAYHKCDRGALSWRIRGLTKSKKDANSFWHQCLTNEQEEVLIARINDLTDRGMPPTSQIVRNLAEEIRREHIGKN